MQEPRRAAGSPAPAAMDPNGLLTQCESIRDTMSCIEISLRTCELRLETFKYVAEYHPGEASLHCIDSLAELRTQSQRMVRQLEQLQASLASATSSMVSSTSATNTTAASLDYQIASQQIAYFTSEWCDSYRLKINALHKLASQYEQQSDSSKHQAAGSQTGAKDMSRVREALLRLRESMAENERLIASISNNIEYTRVTVDAIFNGLQASRQKLHQGKTNTVEAIKHVREANNWQLLLIVVIAIAVILIMYKLVS